MKNGLKHMDLTYCTSLEQEVEQNNSNEQRNFSTKTKTDSDIISEREKDVIIDVVKGMSNKEITDHLCISFNTVTTHRRNIAQKHLHSQSCRTHHKHDK